MIPENVTGQPMLVLLDKTAKNSFSSYIVEILDVEGFFARKVKDLSVAAFTFEELAAYDIVILANIELTENQKALIDKYVRTRGNLIALRPPKDMDYLFGLKANRGINKRVSERYLGINREHPLGQDVAADVLQFHDEADIYIPDGAEVLAYLYGDFEAKTAYPAVSTYRVEKGHTAAFAYDLATSTVLFHQGNFENSSVGSHPDADSDSRWIPNDLFINYLDYRLKFVPQADIHQDLLVRIINWMAGFKRPIPRIWYFPEAQPCVAYFNGDSDGMNQQDYEEIISLVEKYDGKFTVYLMQQHHKVIPPPVEKEFRARGHSFGQHIILDWLLSF